MTVVRRLVFGVGALAVVGAAAALALRAPPETVAPALAPVPVLAVPVQQHDLPIVLSGIGTVQALNSATVRSQITGLLDTVNFIEGQQVRRGDVLAQIDPRTYQSKLSQAQAQLGRDQAQLADTQTNLARNVPLLQEGFATDQTVTNQRSQVDQLQNTVKADQAEVDNAQTQLSYATLTAPFDGVTGVRLLDVGNIIHPTDPSGLVVVNQVQPISILFTLPADKIDAVQDALAKGSVAATAYDQTGKAVLDEGRLLLINNQADPHSGTVQLKALFPNLHNHLWPGVFVNVSLTTAMVQAALTVPTDAVQQGAAGQFIFVIGADHKVTPRPVKTGQRLHDVTLVTTGLSVCPRSS